VQLLLTMSEVLDGALHTRDYNFIKLPLVTNNISNVPGKKELLFVEGAGHEVRRGVAFSHAQIRSLVPVLWPGGVGMPERVAEAAHVFRSGTVSGGEEYWKCCSPDFPGISFVPQLASGEVLWSRAYGYGSGRVFVESISYAGNPAIGKEAER